MQLVLSSNRIIAHGENFLAMGGVVINTVTGAKFENATIAECDGCPSDIDKVGYEYHGGVFVPCAPYGTGNNNGYFMEVCETCATPRSSGIPIKDLKFDKIASGTCNIEIKQSANAYTAVITFPVSESVLSEYSMLRYRIKAGSYFSFNGLTLPQGQVNTYFDLLYAGNGTSGNCIFGMNCTHSTRGGTSAQITIDFANDIVVPVYLTSRGSWSVGATNAEYAEVSVGEPTQTIKWFDSSGGIVDSPQCITVNMPYAAYGWTAVITAELEGRK
jgi:hypothetical protein